MNPTLKIILKILGYIMGFFVLLFVGLVVYFMINPEEVGVDNSLTSLDVPESNSNVANLYFYDVTTNCSLDGEIYLNDIFIGNTSNSRFILTAEDYNKTKTLNSTLSIKGVTSSCFGKDQNLPFFELWDLVDYLDSFFYTNQTAIFEARLTPRQPRYYAAMMGFVRPNEVTSELGKMYFDSEDSTSETMNSIFEQFYMPYATDPVYEYWRTPADSMRDKGGDCEDWAVRFVSLLRAHNSSYNCYAALLSTHVTVICRVDNVFIIYDQSKTTGGVTVDKNPTNDISITNENKLKVREWIKWYYGVYGLSRQEGTINALFNEKELLTFNNSNENFVSWAVSFQ